MAEARRAGAALTDPCRRPCAELVAKLLGPDPAEPLRSAKRVNNILNVLSKLLREAQEAELIAVLREAAVERSLECDRRCRQDGSAAAAQENISERCVA